MISHTDRFDQKHHTGVLVFDEGHKAKKLVPEKEGKGFGKTKSTKTALCVDDLQQRLPKARVCYVSATGASSLENLGYMTRVCSVLLHIRIDERVLSGPNLIDRSSVTAGALGPRERHLLRGPEGVHGRLRLQALHGRARADRHGCVAYIHTDMTSGVDCLTCSSNPRPTPPNAGLKAQGKYLARTLSFADTSFKIERVPLADEFKAKYDKLAEAWYNLLEIMHEVRLLDSTIIS